MRLDRLTNKFQLALADAQSLALGHDNQFIEPLHLMSALLNQEGGSVSPFVNISWHKCWPVAHRYQSGIKSFTAG